MLFKLLRRFVTAAGAGEHARSHASINTPTHTHVLSHPFTRTYSHTHTPEITHLHVVPHQLTCASQVPKPGPAPFPGGGGQGALLSAELSPLPRTSDPPGLRRESARTRPLPRGPGPGLGGLDSAEHGQGTQALTAGRLPEPAASPAGLDGSPGRQHRRIRLAGAPANRASPGPTWTVESELRGAEPRNPPLNSPFGER